MNPGIEQLICTPTQLHSFHVPGTLMCPSLRDDGRPRGPYQKANENFTAGTALRGASASADLGEDAEDAHEQDPAWTRRLLHGGTMGRAWRKRALCGRIEPPRDAAHLQEGQEAIRDDDALSARREATGQASSLKGRTRSSRIGRDRLRAPRRFKCM